MSDVILAALISAFATLIVSIIGYYGTVNSARIMKEAAALKEKAAKEKESLPPPVPADGSKAELSAIPDAGKRTNESSESAREAEKPTSDGKSSDDQFVQFWKDIFLQFTRKHDTFYSRVKPFLTLQYGYILLSLFIVNLLIFGYFFLVKITPLQNSNASLKYNLRQSENKYTSLENDHKLNAVTRSALFKFEKGNASDVKFANLNATPIVEPTNQNTGNTQKPIVPWGSIPPERHFPLDISTDAFHSLSENSNKSVNSSNDSFPFGVTSSESSLEETIDIPGSTQPNPVYAGIALVSSYYPDLAKLNLAAAEGWLYLPDNKRNQANKFHAMILGKTYNLGGIPLISYSHDVNVNPGEWTKIRWVASYNVKFTEPTLAADFRFSSIDDQITDLEMIVWAENPYAGPVYFDDISLYAFR